MLIPQFGIRTILAIMTVLGAVSLVGSQAVRGNAAAVGFLAGLGGVVLFFLLSAALHAAVSAAYWRRAARELREPAPPAARLEDEA